jgi:glycosyltransferase involved in cell wall biosynthesis
MPLSDNGPLPDVVDRGAEPEVTIVCITYNHEQYIAEAIDSFLSQRTSFRFQVFVGEDRGPDGTADIIRDYAARYPGVVIPFIREENMGAQRNLIDMCQRANTRYVAFCEGDDFWTDDHKLQKQYDYMEANPEMAGCFHNTEIKSDEDWYLSTFYRPDEDGRRLIPYSIPRYDQTIRAMRMGYYIRFGPAHTSSMFFRWKYDLEIPEWYFGTIFGDHPIMAMQIGNGLLGFMPDVMSVYRRHAGGAIMSNSERDHHLATRQDWLTVLEGLAEYFHKHHGGFAVSDIEARMVTEMRNHLSHAARSQQRSDVIRAISDHPAAFERMMSDYDQTSALRYNLISRLWGADAAGVRPGALSGAMSLVPSHTLRRRRIAAERNRAKDYERLTSTPKGPDVWLFACDDKSSYLGNVRSLYEYVVAHHPEIRPCWLAWSAQVVQLLRSEGLPVVDLKTPAGRSRLGEASVLFCESLRSDIFEMRGFNAGLRIVRLLDNRYHRNHEHMEPLLATETRTDDDERVEGSPRDWKSESNLVVTDSRALADRLGAEPGASPSRIVYVRTEPRLMALPEVLVPVRARHVLVNPGDSSNQQAEHFGSWIVEHAIALDERAASRGAFVDVFMPSHLHVKTSVADRVAGLSHVAMLTTMDVYAHLERFAAAVSGADPLVFSLARKGVPLSMCVAADEGVRDSSQQLWSRTAPGPVFINWMDAFGAALDSIDQKEPVVTNVQSIESEFGVEFSPDTDSLASVVGSVRKWMTEGAAE